METEVLLPCSKKPPLVPIPIRMNPVHTFPHFLFKIYSNVILLSRPRLFEWSVSFRSSDQSIIYISDFT